MIDKKNKAGLKSTTEKQQRVHNKPQTRWLGHWSAKMIDPSIGDRKNSKRKGGINETGGYFLNGGVKGEGGAAGEGGALCILYSFSRRRTAEDVIAISSLEKLWIIETNKNLWSGYLRNEN